MTIKLILFYLEPFLAGCGLGYLIGKLIGFIYDKIRWYRFRKIVREIADIPYDREISILETTFKRCDKCGGDGFI